MEVGQQRAEQAPPDSLSLVVRVNVDFGDFVVVCEQGVGGVVAESRGDQAAMDFPVPPTGTVARKTIGHPDCAVPRVSGVRSGSGRVRQCDHAAESWFPGIGQPQLSTLVESLRRVRHRPQVNVDKLVDAADIVLHREGAHADLVVVGHFSIVANGAAELTQTGKIEHMFYRVASSGFHVRGASYGERRYHGSVDGTVREGGGHGTGSYRQCCQDEQVA